VKELLPGLLWFKIVLDIALVSFIIYRILLLLRGTKKGQILMSLSLILIAYFGSDIIGLTTLKWLLNNFMSSIVLVIIILFQNDIRRALTVMGRRRLFWSSETEESPKMQEEIIKAVYFLSEKRIGALIVIERQMPVDEFIHSGTEVDSNVNRELIQSVFLPYSPLHDGAVLVKNGRIASAGNILPMTDEPGLAKEFGTRHRAAIGLTEQCDAVVLVVSEETGIPSLVFDGRIERNMGQNELRDRLSDLLPVR
jgi:diadenylate cyclase